MKSDPGENDGASSSVNYSLGETPRFLLLEWCPLIVDDRAGDSFINETKRDETAFTARFTVKNGEKGAAVSYRFVNCEPSGRYRNIFRSFHPFVQRRARGFL